VIRASSPGSFEKTFRALNTLKSGQPFKDLEPSGRRGVDALSRATPIDTGETANSWDFQTSYDKSKYSLSWFNTNIENGMHVAVAIQYGHGTRGGGFVEGVDYINPAVGPIMDRTIEEAWKKVRDA
jgi:hypothetical protein